MERSVCAVHGKQDSQTVQWLKSSYLSMAMEYVSLGQKMAVMLFGRDIRHVLLLHIGAFDSVMLPALLDSLQKQGFDFVSLQEAEEDPAYQTDPDAALSTGGTLLEQMVESKAPGLSAARGVAAGETRLHLPLEVFSTAIASRCRGQQGS